MSCACADCGSKTNSVSDMFMYRKLKGKDVFTGFVKRGPVIVWIGKDERGQEMVVDTKDASTFFLSEMKQYDR